MNAIAVERVADFEAVCADPYAIAREAAASGRRVAGSMCTYAPGELLHAAGYLPVRILGWTDGTQLADSLMQSYACTVARSALHAALSGDLDFLELMLFTHTCDTIQNLTDIWKRNLPRMRHLSIAMPVCTAGEAPVTLLCDELRRARAFLESGGVAVTDEALWESIRLYGEDRAMMRKLYALRRERPGRLSGRRMLSVAVSSLLMPKEDHLALVSGLVGELEHASGHPADDKPRVFVVGSVCQLTEYMAAIEDAGCMVADDDLCTGAREFAFDTVDAGDPIESIARTYLARTPCPAKHRPGYDVGKDVHDKARLCGAEGVVMLFTKFCDPWAFDYPRIRETLEAAGLPSLLLEIEPHQPPAEQFRTRVEAFAEMLASK